MVPLMGFEIILQQIFAQIDAGLLRPTTFRASPHLASSP